VAGDGIAGDSLNVSQNPLRFECGLEATASGRRDFLVQFGGGNDAIPKLPGVGSGAFAG
jgi:hypothetical protein